MSPPSSRQGGLDLDAAYAVAAEIARVRRGDGHHTVGWKVGYANRTIWPVHELETLVWAHLYEDTVRYADWNDGTLSIASMIAPRITPQIVFALARTPASADAIAVLEATEWYGLGFEIVDCVFPDWTFQPADFVAAGGLHAALVVGEPVYIEPDDIARLADDLGRFTLRLLKNNELVAAGTPADALDNPASCVGELHEALGRRGAETLQAGDIVSTGALTTSLPMAAGDTWIASLSGIPPSSLTLRVS
jgi:2-keto-4-pentenoate hydratase